MISLIFIITFVEPFLFSITTQHCGEKVPSAVPFMRCVALAPRRTAARKNRPKTIFSPMEHLSTFAALLSYFELRKACKNRR